MSVPKAIAPGSLLSLAERVEHAAGADRLLDANILWAIRPEEFEADAGDDDEHLKPSFCYARGGWTMNRADRYYLETIPVPKFTGSLDDAMALVPKGWQLTLRQLDGLVRWGADLSHDDTDVEVFSNAPSAAMAITAAALRACAHQSGEQA